MCLWQVTNKTTPNLSASDLLISRIDFHGGITLNLHHRRVRIAGLAAGLIIPAVLLGALSFAQGGQKPETAGQSKKFKNIKVLKEIPADQLIPVMHNWSASLSVKCDFCHVINADHSGFDLDTKPEKNKARAMLLMVNDIKKRERTVEGKATCFMCHHGSPEPMMEPMAK